MTRIKIQTNAIKDVSQALTQSYSRIYEAHSTINMVKGNIDYQILSRRNIGPRLAEVSHSLKKNEYALKNINTCIEAAIDIYSKTEKSIVKLAEIKFPEGNDWELIKSISAGFAAYFGSKVNLQLGDIKFKLIKENNRFYIKLIGGNPREYIRYRDLLIQKFGGNAGLWKKGVYRRLIGRGIPLYEALNIEYNQNIGFRENFRRFASNSADDLSNYISHISDSKMKIFGKTFTKSVFGTVTDFNLLENKSLAKIGGKSLGILGTGITIIENAKQSKNLKEFAVNTGVDVGFGAGAAAVGAAVGSAFVPPVGTVVGAAVGVGVNFTLNMKILPGDKSIVDVTKEFANNPVENSKKIGKTIGDWTNNAVENIGRGLANIF